MRRQHKAWPEVRIVTGGNSGCCRQRIVYWCERANMHFTIGLVRIARFEAMVEYVHLALHDE